MPELEPNFFEVLRNYTAGDPMREGIRWTNLTLKEIAERLRKTSTPVSVTVVRQLLKKHDYRKRKARKTKAMGKVAHRNEQFENIARLRDEFWDSPNPIVSMDSKKKEYLGAYYRPGWLYTLETVDVFDHDFDFASDGVILTHGLYDLKRNVGHINLGFSHDTGEFACDSVYRWWRVHGRWWYPDATLLLLLCDSGGSNDYRHYLFKQDLQRLADRIGLEIRVAHYPAYCSKYNPIEHRMFPHVTRACQGVIFDSVATVKQLMRKAKTRTGLRVTVDTIKKAYEVGRKYAADFKETMRIIFDEHLPRWNYRAIPQADWCPA